MTPECPPGYTCTFDPIPPPEHHYLGPWYETSWGIVVSILAIIALVVIVWILADAWLNWRQAKRAALEEEHRRQHELDLEEQRTMQLDAAKGNPEMLKLVRERVR